MDTKESRSTKFQYFAALSANIIMLGYGCGIGWVAVALPLLQSVDTPLTSGILSLDQKALLSSILSIGSLSGNFVFGFLVNYLGSKRCMLIAGFVQASSWVLLIFGRHVIFLFVSRFCTGFVTGGAQICISLYIAEIADNAIRGRLGTFYQFGRNFGILFACAIGTFFNYIYSAMFFLAFTAVFYATFTFLPQTPQYLLHRNETAEAEIAYRYYKGYENRKGSVSHLKPFTNMQNVNKEVSENWSVNRKDLWRARKGFLVAVLFPLFNMMSGSYVILTYGTDIINEAQTKLSPNVSLIGFAGLQIIGTYLSSELVDRKGRKFLLIISLAGCAIGHATFYAYMQLVLSGIDVGNFDWVPILCMGFIVFMAAIGIIPLTLICTLEYFDSKLRPIGLTFGNVANNILTFVIMYLYPLTNKAIGISNCVLIFAIACSVGVAYIIFGVRETRGKELNVVNTTDDE